MPVDPQALTQSMPFAVALGVEVTAAAPEEVRGRLGWTPERCTTGGVLHGAALMALGDTLDAICAFLNLPPGAGTTTIESKTNFFRAVRGYMTLRRERRGVGRQGRVGRGRVWERRLN